MARFRLFLGARAVAPVVEPEQVVTGGRGKRKHKPQPPTILSHYYAGDTRKQGTPEPDPRQVAIRGADIPPAGQDSAEAPVHGGPLGGPSMAGAILASQGALLATELAVAQIQAAAVAEAARVAVEQRIAEQQRIAQQIEQQRIAAIIEFEQRIEDDAIALLLLSN